MRCGARDALVRAALAGALAMATAGATPALAQAAPPSPTANEATAATQRSVPEPVQNPPAVAEPGAAEGEEAHPAPTPAPDNELEGLDDDFDVELDLYGEPDVPDPLEKVNRGVFFVNREIDRWALDPLTRFYGWLFPDPIKAGVRNFFQNVDSPVVTVNDMIQLEWTDAGVTVARFAINTTVGVLGVWDPARRIGLEWHHSDFGQTLALAGVPSGPYLVLPIMGPTTFRDGIGFGVDTALNPLTWLVGPIELLGIGGADGISVREAHLESLRALEQGSVDFYSTFRTAYTQNRRAEIWSRRADRRPHRDGDGDGDAAPGDTAAHATNP